MAGFFGARAFLARLFGGRFFGGGVDVDAPVAESAVLLAPALDRELAAGAFDALVAPAFPALVAPEWTWSLAAPATRSTTLVAGAVGDGVLIAEGFAALAAPERVTVLVAPSTSTLPAQQKSEVV